MLKQRKKEPTTKDYVEQIKKVSKEPVDKPTPVRFNKVVSTGSTTLDLAISGGRVRGGGIPGGILVEVFGPSGSGKTAILEEVCASTQAKGGEIHFADTEARLDKEYARIYGVELSKKNYSRPHTVNDLFDLISNWKTKNPNIINTIAADSLDALTTDWQIDGKDARGQRRAKQFSEGLRLVKKSIRNNGDLIINSNQVRDGEYGEVTPGGKGIPFYCSLRVRVAQVEPIERTKTLKTVTKGPNGETITKEKKVEKAIGIKSACYVKKSTIDDPYRTADIYLIFNYGIHDIMGNLQYLKDMTKDTTYDCITKSYQSIDKAVKWIEDNNLENELKNKVIDLWEEVQDLFKVERKLKKRG
jgi:RecA/RadA recombinase